MPQTKAEQIQIEVFRDSHGHLVLQDIIQPSHQALFQALEGSFLSLDFNEDFYWLRVILPQTNPDKDYYLSLGTVHLEEVKLFYQTHADGTWHTVYDGYRVNWQDKAYKYHRPSFPLPREMMPVVYLRLRNKNIGFEIALEEGPALILKSQNKYFAFGLVCGLMLFVIVYNLYLAFYLKSRSHYYYSLLVFFYVLFAASYEGYWYYVVKSIPWYVYQYTPLGASIITALCWGMVPVYTASFYQLGAHSIWFRLRNGFLIYWLGLIFMLHQLPWVVTMAKLGALMVLIYTISLSWQKIKEAYPGARFFLIAYIVYFILTCLEVLFLNGSFKQYLSVSYTTLGALLEALILSSSLAQKTAAEKHKLEMEKTLALNENIRLIKEQKHMLELMVREKTFKIRKKNRTLKGLNRELRKQQNEILEQKEAISNQNKLLQDAYATIDTQNRKIQDRNENLEEEVKSRTAELLDHNQALQQFAFIAAHNLRAPVSRIKGLGALLVYPETTSEDEKMYKEFIFRSISELDEVIKDLSLVLNIKKNYTQVLSDVFLEAELERIRLNLSEEILSTNARLITDWHEEASLRTIKPYFYSILYNLISNAIKYRRSDIDPVIHIRSRILGGEICLEIQDNGLGIDLEAYGKKLFQLYQRFHFHVEGKGMGLFLVKTQVEALKGRIEIESVPQEGTLFKIFFPVIRPESSLA